MAKMPIDRQTIKEVARYLLRFFIYFLLYYVDVKSKFYYGPLTFVIRRHYESIIESPPPQSWATGYKHPEERTFDVKKRLDYELADRERSVWQFIFTACIVSD
jgi:hypothetical protein